MEDERKKLPKAKFTLAGVETLGYYDSKQYLFYVTDENGDIIETVNVQSSLEHPVIENKENAPKKKGLSILKKEKTEKSPEEAAKKNKEKEKKEKPERAGRVVFKPVYIFTILGIIAAAALVLAGAYAYKLGAKSQVPNNSSNTNTNTNVNTEPSKPVVKGETVKVMRASREIMPNEPISSDNIMAFEVSVETQSKDQILLYSRLESYAEADYRASKYIEEGSLIYPSSISTTPINITNPWLGDKNLTYFDIILTDAVIAEEKASWGKLLTITVYPKDAPDPEANIPEGITAETPGDPESKYTLTVPICDVTNERGENYFKELSLLSRIPAKDQRFYLDTYLKEHEGFANAIKPFNAKIALTAAQAAYLGDVSRRGAITNMVVTDKWDNSTDAKKNSYSALAVLFDNLAYMTTPESDAKTND